MSHVHVGFCCFAALFSRFCCYCRCYIWCSATSLARVRGAHASKPRCVHVCVRVQIDRCFFVDLLHCWEDLQMMQAAKLFHLLKNSDRQELIPVQHLVWSLMYPGRGRSRGRQG